MSSNFFRKRKSNVHTKFQFYIQWNAPKLFDTLHGPDLQDKLSKCNLCPKPNDYDVDSWNLTTKVSTLHYYFTQCNSISLNYHHWAVTDLEDYDDWVFIGQAGTSVRFEPQFKEPFIKKLEELYGIQLEEAKHSLSLIEGTHKISVGMLAQCLEAIGVEELRLNSFGMKSPLNCINYNLGAEYRNSYHTNWFDIGINYHLKDIILMDSALPNATIYPLLLSLGQGAGSVDIRPKHKFFSKIKIYPRLVHTLKSLSAKHLRSLPTSTRAWNGALKSIEKKLSYMKNSLNQNIGGFRIEVSVCAPSLAKAVALVEKEGLLNIQKYTRSIRSKGEKLKVQFSPVNVEDYFNYLEEMIEKAKTLDIRHKHDCKMPLTRIETKVVGDVCNAMGWNVGKWRPTNWNDMDAWWRQIGEFLFFFLVLSLFVFLLFFLLLLFQPTNLDCCYSCRSSIHQSRD